MRVEKRARRHARKQHGDARASRRARSAFSSSPRARGVGRAKNDDLVAKLRLGDSVDAGRAVKPTRLERAAARVNRERDAATKAVLAFALGVVSMMPTMTTDAPTPQPVVSGVKRTMVAGTVKSATSDATRRRETAAEAQFTRDVERFVGRMSM